MVWSHQSIADVIPNKQKKLNYDNSILVLAIILNTSRHGFANSQLPQELLIKKQYLPHEREQQINLMVHGSQPNDTRHSIGKPGQPTAPPYCYSCFWHQTAPSSEETTPSYAPIDRSGCRNCHRHFIYKPWGEKKVFTAHIGWENGKSFIIKFLCDSYKLPPWY